MSNNYPSCTVYSLSDLDINVDRNMIKLHESILRNLCNSTVTSIINALNQTIIHNYGVAYVDMSLLHILLRTSGVGSSNYYVNQGIEGICSPVDPIHIDGKMYIKGPDFLSLVQARMLCTSGRQHTYLRCVRDLFLSLLDHSVITNLIFLRREIIQSDRNQLKHRRIECYNITRCEFTGIEFKSRQDVDFAHVFSVDVNPFRSLDINNGVIILKRIHRDLTKQGIQDFPGMLQYCETHDYDIDWAEDVE